MAPAVGDPSPPLTCPTAADVVVLWAPVTTAWSARATSRRPASRSSSWRPATWPGATPAPRSLTLPGFAHDSCSSAHVLIQSNPLIRDDELDLLSTYGLEYVLTDPAVVLPQPDGDALVMHRDLDGTADEIARWSPADAEAFRDLLSEWSGGLAAVHGRWSSGLPLGEDDAARRYLALREQSAWDVVHQRFSHPTIRSFILWLAMATIQDPRRPGTGFLPSSTTAGRINFGWATPIGGSNALPNALIRQIEAHGGGVVCSSPRSPGSTWSAGARSRSRRRTVVGSQLAAQWCRAPMLAQLADMLKGTETPRT